MDKETKITYSASIGFIVILGAIAYFLQPMGIEDKKNELEAQRLKSTSETTKKVVSTSTQKLTVSTTTLPTMEEKKYTNATITTNKGVIEITFETSKPVTVANFSKLASQKFYDGTRFHRVIKDFMIQGGDPLSKDTGNMAAWGTGGPGYKFNDENIGNETYPQGTLAMANSGPNTNGSQFFIVTGASGYNPPSPAYTVFGRVTKGLEVALAIQNVATGANDRPTSDVIIEKVEVK